MSIASEIIRLQTAKANIKSAIEDKGVDVPASATLDTYDEYISGITTGGGSSANEIGLVQRTLTSYDIPSGTTYIGRYAFFYFLTLTAVTIPNTVTSIGDNAFNGCPGLLEMVFSGSTPPTLGGANNSLGATSYAFPIYVPDSAVSAYKTAYTNYASRIVGISEKLPSGYTRLSYLDNSAGTMQIDMLNLPFNVDGDTSIEIKFQLTGNDGVLYANLDGLIISNGYVVRGGTTEYGTLLSSGVDSVIAMDTAGDVTVNGTTVLQVADGENWFVANMATVFDGAYPEGYLYYIKIWNSGTLVANYIPAQNSSNVNGLYDGVNSTWYPDVNN